MKSEIFQYKTVLAASPEEVFAWHKKPGAFEALCPPWMDVDVVQSAGGLRTGGKVSLKIHCGPINVDWHLEHRNYIEGEQFQDVQTSGPFAAWEHTHKFNNTDRGCVLEDHIEFQMPVISVPGTPVSGLIREELRRMFAYRKDVLTKQLSLNKMERIEPMNIAISGSHGLVGAALLPLLTTKGHSVKRLVRSGGAASNGDISYSPNGSASDFSALNGIDAVVHLAGEGIASSRWTEQKKIQIRDSRVNVTRALSEGLAKLANPPKVLICASAIGFYGDRGAEELDENSSSGEGFLAEVCREWEAATSAAEAAGIRVVHLRTGIIMSPKGGALAQMLTPFQMGAGGPIGNGKQYMSWIAIDDEAGAIHHCLTHDNVKGAVNLVAPQAVTNNEFTKALGKVLHRPTFCPVPDFAARLVFGEMADALLLSSARVKPAKLLSSGYEFLYPEIEGALHHVLGR